MPGKAGFLGSVALGRSTASRMARIARKNSEVAAVIFSRVSFSCHLSAVPSHVHVGID